MPMVIAAPTKSSCRSSSTRPRTSRARGGMKLDGDGDDEARDACPDRGRDRDGENEARHRQQEVDEPVTTRSTFPPRWPAMPPSATPTSAGDEDRRHCNKECVTRAGDDAREDVAPDLIGPEGMCPARRLHRREQVLFCGIVGRKRGADDRHCHEEQDQRAADPQLQIGSARQIAAGSERQRAQAYRRRGLTRR